MPRRHSVSSVKTYEICPQQWHFKYVQRVKIEDFEVPYHWRKGRVIHAGLEAAYDARARNVKPWDGAPLTSMEQYFDVAEITARKAWVENDMGEPEGSDWHDTLRQIGLSLASVDLPGRPDFVLGVEHKFLLSTPDGTPMIGFADLVEAIARATILVRDWKSNQYVLPAEVLADDFQLATYAALARIQWPWVKNVYASQFHTPLGRENKVLITEEAQEDALARIEAVTEMMETDPVVPRKGPACADCLFKPMCPAWEDERSDPAMLAVENF